jgi:hypothetical protein
MNAPYSLFTFALVGEVDREALERGVNCKRRSCGLPLTRPRKGGGNGPAFAEMSG